MSDATMRDLLAYEAGKADGVAAERKRITTIIVAEKMRIVEQIMTEYRNRTDSDKRLQGELARQERVLVNLLQDIDATRAGS